MALKPHMYAIAEDISYFVLTITGPSTTRMEKGGILCVAGGTTPGSGQALDSSSQYVQYVTDPSGYQPLGVLMTDVVDIDLSRQQVNPYKEETVIGNKVPVIRKGEVTTNMIVPGQGTGTMPALAYAGPSGLFSTLGTGAGLGRPLVGKFMTRIDSDGFARIYVDV